MYLRAVHAENSLQALQTLIKQNPLGIFTTAISPSAPEHSNHLIQSSHIPFVLDIPDDSSESNPGVLRGHMARANPQAKLLIDAAASKNGVELPHEVQVLFNGPYHHYVTPKFYTTTKPETGKVVPTWNYAAAQAHGKVKVFWDSKAEETSRYLQTQIEDLTKLNEEIMGYSTASADKGKAGGAWEVGDAPDNYIEIMKKGIIGIEIRLESLGGKFKMSQELPVGDREGVIAGFAGLGSDAGNGISKTVKERGEMKDQGKQKS